MKTCQILLALFPVILVYQALPSKVIVDLPTELEEEKEYKVNCTVYDVAPSEYLTINITRGGDVIDSKSCKGPHVVGKRTVHHFYTFNASRSDHHMNFSCEAILQLGSATYTSKSSEIHVTTYSMSEDPVIMVDKWIENGTSFTAECTVANGFPPENILLNMLLEDTRVHVTPVLTSEGTVKGTFQLNATYSRLGANVIICQSELFTLSKDALMNVTIYELPTVTFTLSKNIVDLEENVTATCDITSKHPEDYRLFISVGGKEELRVQDSTVTHTVTASRRTPSLPITCTAEIIGNSSIFRSSEQILEVQYPPEFTESLCPSSVILVEGETFSCQADGNPQPIVECSADGRDINGTVTVTRDMSETYNCRASNKKGNITKSVSVTVEYKPVISMLTVSVNTTIKTGDPLNITCKSDGLPAPAYSWHIPNNAKVMYSSDRSSIIIHTADWTHHGIYTCVARNRHGEADKEQEVTVLPDELNIGLIVGIAIGAVILVTIISSIWYFLWKRGRRGIYELLRPSHRQCHQNGNIPSEAPADTTTNV
ncbi:hypothetical protein GDO78_004831 [Eleutherodactylus coqui]|uniref:Ig-like domain-containing protein n=1 Tax=Eleutherodactylus coqui TaxID=57060 RepID=A0A8J6FIG7_ELECQ|nr:hypothetical protein GDO78_004831 [Eleutherodactylus coqui]